MVAIQKKKQDESGSEPLTQATKTNHNTTYNNSGKFFILFTSALLKPLEVCISIQNTHDCLYKLCCYGGQLISYLLHGKRKIFFGFRTVLCMAVFMQYPPYSYTKKSREKNSLIQRLLMLSCGILPDAYVY